MSWIDVARDQANAVLRKRSGSDQRIFGHARSMGWHSGEVWLARVRQPRETARSSAPSKAVSAA